MIVFYFIRPRTLLDHIVAWVTFGAYSHVVVEIAGYYYQATLRRGVTIHNKVGDVGSDLTPSGCDALAVMLPESILNKYLNFLAKQIGKGYDVLGVFAYIFPILRNKMFERYWRGKWYCSELGQAMMMFIDGRPLKRVITPTQLYDEIVLLDQWVIRP